MFMSIANSSEIFGSTKGENFQIQDRHDDRKDISMIRITRAYAHRTFDKPQHSWRAAFHPTARSRPCILIFVYTVLCITIFFLTPVLLLGLLHRLVLPVG